MNILKRYIFAFFYKYFIFFKKRRFVKTKDFSTKEIRFSGDSIKSSGDSIKSCVGCIDLVDSPKNTITMEGLESIRKYYSTIRNYYLTFYKSISETLKDYDGKIIKYDGDCLLVSFPKTSDSKDMEVFRETIDCGFKILDERYIINQELSKQHLPPFNYRITIDYGVVDLALVGDYSQINLFGSTLNICSKINASSLSTPNTLIIGENFYRILKSFSSIMNNYNFINNGEYHITENNLYSIYAIKRKNDVKLSDTEGIC